MLLILLGIAVILPAAVWAGIRALPGFGSFRLSAAEAEAYAARSANFREGRFVNETEFPVMEKVPEGAPTGVLSRKEGLPVGVIPVETPELSPAPSGGELRFTWLGHSSLLLQTEGMNILYDPVLSENLSPVGFWGVKRCSAVPIAPEDLPEIDLLLLTHDHYDHLDYTTVRHIDSRVKRYVVPLGVEKRLARFGVDPGKITAMAWWEELELGPLTLGCTPACHFSGRNLWDRGKTLWCSFVLRTSALQIFLSGDGGYAEHFQAIRDRYGPFDLAFMECGQYDLRWPSVHMSPEEGYAALKILGAARAVPIHWAAFRLASHPWDDGPVRLVSAGSGGEIDILTPRIGQTVDYNEADNYRDRWYEAIS